MASPRTLAPDDLRLVRRYAQDVLRLQVPDGQAELRTWALALNPRDWRKLKGWIRQARHRARGRHVTRLRNAIELSTVPDEALVTECERRGFVVTKPSQKQTPSEAPETPVEAVSQTMAKGRPSKTRMGARNPVSGAQGAITYRRLGEGSYAVLMDGAEVGRVWCERKSLRGRKIWRYTQGRDFKTRDLAATHMLRGKGLI